MQEKEVSPEMCWPCGAEGLPAGLAAQVTQREEVGGSVMKWGAEAQAGMAVRWEGTPNYNAGGRSGGGHVLKGLDVLGQTGLPFLTLGKTFGRNLGYNILGYNILVSKQNKAHPHMPPQRKPT